MAGIGEIAGPGLRASVLGRALAVVRDRSESGRNRVFAAGAFAARVANAGLGFATQIGLARWMGEREYGLYASAWVWVLVAGGIGSLGLPVAALKFVPDYRERGDLAGLRGFLFASRWLGSAPSLVLALGGIALASADPGRLGSYGPVAVVALAALPLYVLTDIQTGIARAWDFADLGLAADYLVRPLLLLLFAAALFLAGEAGSAQAVMGATLAAVALTALGQGAILQRRVRARVAPGPRRFDRGRWAAAAWPLLTVTGFTLLLGAVDVMVLQLVASPEEIAVYFAATKIVAIASFVSYGVSNTSAHRFAVQIARGDRDGMRRLAAETVRWTFWPTLAVALALCALSLPLLRLFGPSFAGGAPVVCILAAGLAAGAAVGPADRALAMADHGPATARIYAIAVLANAALALLLVPRLGLAGAALATSLAVAIKAALLYAATRQRLGLSMSVFSRAGIEG